MSKIISTLSKMWLKVVNLENSLFPELQEYNAPKNQHDGQASKYA